jgi:hypothetical protein
MKQSWGEFLDLCYDVPSAVLVGVMHQSPYAVNVMSLLEVYFSSSSKDISMSVVSVTSDVEWLGYRGTPVVTE